MMRVSWKGIWLRLLASALFAGMALCVKKAATEAPVGQIVFWCSSVALIPIVFYLVYLRVFPLALKTKNWRGHLERSAYGCLAMFFSFISLAYLPLTLASIFGFLAPMLAIPMAALYLGEHPGGHLIAMVLMGFFGVLITLYPMLESPEMSQATLLGSAAGLIMAIVTALAKVKIKQLTQTEHPGSIAFYFALTCSGVGGATVLAGDVTTSWQWAELTTQSVVWLLGAGFLGGLAHVIMTEAVARASVSTLAVFEYSAIFWALSLDFIFFGDVPGLLSLLGVSIIITAGLNIIRRQNTRMNQ
ncbi:DMT family transporter [Oceanospirillum linum]|nr:DMT family transporter [Oceanospirillum linum]